MWLLVSFVVGAYGHAGEDHGLTECYGSIMAGAVIDGTLVAADWKAQRVLLIQDGSVVHEWDVGPRARPAQEIQEDQQYIAIGPSSVEEAALVFRLQRGITLQAAHVFLNTTTINWRNTTDCGLMPKIRTKSGAVVLLDVSTGMLHNFHWENATCDIHLNVTETLGEQYMGASLCDEGSRCYLGSSAHDQDFVKVWSFDYEANKYWFYTQRKAPRSTTIVEYNRDTGNFTELTSDLWMGSLREDDNEGKNIYHPYGDVFYNSNSLLVIVSEVDMYYSTRVNFPQDSSVFMGKIIEIDLNTSDIRTCAYGIRHAWSSLYFEDTLYLADVGASTFEEINIVREPCAADETYNFMWPVLEGPEIHDASLSYANTGMYPTPIPLEHCQANERCPPSAFYGWVFGVGFLFVVSLGITLWLKKPYYGMILLSTAFVFLVFCVPVRIYSFPTCEEKEWLWYVQRSSGYDTCIESLMVSDLVASRWMTLASLLIMPWFPMVAVPLLLALVVELSLASVSVVSLVLASLGLSILVVRNGIMITRFARKKYDFYSLL